MSAGPSITIRRRPYEEPNHICLEFSVSNGATRGHLEIYTSPEALRELARVLDSFPRHAGSVHLWELGSERPEDRWAYYFRFRAFTTDSRGNCAIQFRLNNNRDFPEREATELCIGVEPNQLARLGKLLHVFAGLEHLVLHWTPTSGDLYETAVEAAASGLGE